MRRLPAGRRPRLLLRAALAGLLLLLTGGLAACAGTHAAAARPGVSPADAIRNDVLRRLPAAAASVAAAWGAAAQRPVEVVVTPGPGSAGAGEPPGGSPGQPAGDVAAAFTGGPRPRLAINSAAWSTLSPIGRDVVLRHELTHLATGGASGADRNLPDWLVEGAAEWTAWRSEGWADARVAPELTRLVRAHQQPLSLASSGDLSPGASDAAAAYSSAWLAVREIVRRGSASGLVRLVRALEQHPGPVTGAALDSSLRAATGDTLAEVVRRWQLAVRRLA